MAAPERPSIAYVGDGAWGMSLNEVLTCVREDIPAIAVVFNNRQWGAEKKNQVRLSEAKLKVTIIKWSITEADCSSHEETFFYEAGPFWNQ